MIGWLHEERLQESLGNLSGLRDLVKPRNSVVHWFRGRSWHGSSEKPFVPGHPGWWLPASPQGCGVLWTSIVVVFMTTTLAWN